MDGHSSDNEYEPMFDLELETETSCELKSENVDTSKSNSSHRLKSATQSCCSSVSVASAAAADGLSYNSNSKSKIANDDAIKVITKIKRENDECDKRVERKRDGGFQNRSLLALQPNTIATTAPASRLKLNSIAVSNNTRLNAGIAQRRNDFANPLDFIAVDSDSDFDDTDDEYLAYNDVTDVSGFAGGVNSLGVNKKKGRAQTTSDFDGRPPLVILTEKGRREILEKEGKRFPYGVAYRFCPEEDEGYLSKHFAKLREVKKRQKA